jgi:hypothetical protein
MTEESVGADPAPILRTNCAQRTLGFSSTRALRAALLDAGRATTGDGSRPPCASASAVMPGTAAWLSPVGALSTETLENVAKRDLRFSERQDIDLARAKRAGCSGERERGQVFGRPGPSRGVTTLHQIPMRFEEVGRDLVDSWETL